MTILRRTLTMDEAFETYRQKTFGVHASYPIDAYTHFGAGWNAARAAEESGWQPTHRHYKGGLYRVIGDAQHSEDGSKLIVYQGEDRRIWVRPRAMFHERLADGQLRFAPLPPAPAAKEPR